MYRTIKKVQEKKLQGPVINTQFLKQKAETYTTEIEGQDYSKVAQNYAQYLHSEDAQKAYDTQRARIIKEGQDFDFELAKQSQQEFQDMLKFKVDFDDKNLANDEVLLNELLQNKTGIDRTQIINIMMKIAFLSKVNMPEFVSFCMFAARQGFGYRGLCNILKDDIMMKSLSQPLTNFLFYIQRRALTSLGTQLGTYSKIKLPILAWIDKAIETYQPECEAVVGTTNISSFLSLSNMQTLGVRKFTLDLGRALNTFKDGVYKNDEKLKVTTFEYDKNYVEAFDELQENFTAHSNFRSVDNSIFVIDQAWLHSTIIQAFPYKVLGFATSDALLQAFYEVAFLKAFIKNQEIFIKSNIQNIERRLFRSVYLRSILKTAKVLSKQDDTLYQVMKNPSSILKWFSSVEYQKNDEDFALLSEIFKIDFFHMKVKQQVKKAKKKLEEQEAQSSESSEDSDSEEDDKKQNKKDAKKQNKTKIK